MNVLSNPDVDRTLQQVFQAVVPEATLVGTACVLLVVGTFQVHRLVPLVLALVGIVGGLLTTWLVPTPEGLIPTVTPFLPDALAQFVRVVALLSGGVLVLVGWSESNPRNSADYLACLLIAIAGLSLTGSANDLLTIFLALEMISIPTYILLYLPRQTMGVQESAVKYFLLSVLSSGLLLFGFSYLYGVTGTLNLTAIVTILPKIITAETFVLAVVAAVMIIAGIGFKITAVPFHFYAPDVYQGGPTGAVAFLAYVPKVAGFAVLLRLLAGTGLTEEVPFVGELPVLIWILAAVTMTFGNVLALLQDNLKRMLAYSSVAHGGYMLIGLTVAVNPDVHEASAALPFGGGEAILFYLVAYGVMTVGAFAVILALHTDDRPVETIDDLAGLHESRPGLALAMMVFLLSLIGIPLTAGFAGKFLLFASALAVPDHPLQDMYYALAVIAAINAAIAAYYYLRVLGVIYLRPEFQGFSSGRSVPLTMTIVICAAITLIAGCYPWPLLDASRDAMGMVGASGDMVVARP